MSCFRSRLGIDQLQKQDRSSQSCWPISSKRKDEQREGRRMKYGETERQRLESSSALILFPTPFISSHDVFSGEMRSKTRRTKGFKKRLLNMLRNNKESATREQEVWTMPPSLSSWLNAFDLYSVGLCIISHVRSWCSFFHDTEDWTRNFKKVIGWQTIKNSSMRLFWDVFWTIFFFNWFAVAEIQQIQISLLIAETVVPFHVTYRAPCALWFPDFSL